MTRSLLHAAALALLLWTTACSSGDGPGSESGADVIDGGAEQTEAHDAFADADQVEAIEPCDEGAFGCNEDRSWTTICSDGAVERMKRCLEGTICLSGACADAGTCVPGEAGACASLAAQNICDASGLGYVPQPCGGDRLCVDGSCVDAACTPGQGACLDATTRATCLLDGSGYGPGEPCAEDETCSGGACSDPCAGSLKYAGSSVGCRFWTVDLGQWNPEPGSISAIDSPAAPIPHAVIIGNPGGVTATIKFTSGDGTPVVVEDPLVPAGEARSFEMPVMSQQATAVTRESIRVVSNQPVVAAQFNPPSNKDFVHTSDASLLLPEEGLGTAYVVVSGDSVGASSFGSGVYGYFTVVAVHEGETEVRVTPSMPTEPGIEIDGIGAGVETLFTLQRFEVLTIQALGSSDLMGPFNDLTGTVIEASQPIVAFGGHDCLNVHQGNCDHVETQLIPVEAWGTEYVAAHMQIPSPNVYRVTAYYEGTTLETDPPVSDFNGKVLARGDWIEATSYEDFVIRADRPFQITSFIAGYDPGGGGGSGVLVDPSLTGLIPTSGFRLDYPLLVPEAYEADWVTVVKPASAALMLDGVPLSEGSFSFVGSGDWRSANIELQEGVHRIEGTQPFGVIAYGYGNKVSYAYPAGANLILTELPTSQP